MHDASCESLMLWLSENPQASLDIFRQSHHHPFGSCIYRKAINRDKPFCPLAYCPPGRGLVVCHISEGVAPGYSV